MLRTQLKIHREVKDISFYVLTAGENPTLTRSNENDVGSRTLRTVTRRLDPRGQPYGDLLAGKASMADLARMIGGIVGGVVKDRTNIEGRFYITLEFDNNGVARPTLAAALREIGLGLELVKVPAEIVVIDDVERPSAQ
jgi:uncharacterized protein (TIGR03435 family)